MAQNLFTSRKTYTQPIPNRYKTIQAIKKPCSRPQTTH